MRDGTWKTIAMLMAIFVVRRDAVVQHSGRRWTFQKDVTGVLAPETELARRTGLVTGYPDGTFRPNERVTRAAFAKMIVIAVEAATPCGISPYGICERLERIGR